MEEYKELPLEKEEEIKKKVESLKKEDPKKYKRVKPIVIFGDEFDEKEIYVGFFIEPNFAAFSKFIQLQKKDDVAALRALARDTFVAGDKEIIDDDSLFLYGLSPELSKILEARQTKVINFSKAGK